MTKILVWIYHERLIAVIVEQLTIATLSGSDFGENVGNDQHRILVV